LKRWWIAAVAVPLVLIVAFGVVLGFGSARAKHPVVVCGDVELTNTELAYCYWSEYFYYAEAYGDYLDGIVDFSTPLSEQTYEGDTTWEDYLLQETLVSVRDTLAMVSRAEAEGYDLSGDYLTTYQNVLVNFSAAAQEGGYRDLDAYLRASYGKHADRESFERYLYRSHLAASYADQLFADCLPSDGDCRDYFSANRAYYEEYYDAVADDETTWLETVRTDLQTERYQNAFREIIGGYELLVDYDAIRLESPEGLYDQK